jgi:hypothetical protein
VPLPIPRPSTTPALTTRAAESFLQEDHYTEAIEELTQAIQLDPVLA